MGRIIKALFLLAVLTALGLVGYAYFGDMSPATTDQRVPVDLNASQ